MFPISLPGSPTTVCRSPIRFVAMEGRAPSAATPGSQLRLTRSTTHSSVDLSSPKSTLSTETLPGPLTINAADENDLHARVVAEEGEGAGGRRRVPSLWHGTVHPSATIMPSRKPATGAPTSRDRCLSSRGRHFTRRAAGRGAPLSAPGVVVQNELQAPFTARRCVLLGRRVTHDRPPRPWDTVFVRSRAVRV